LIGRDDDRRQRGAEQRACKEQRLKLRIRARGGKDHIRVRSRQTKSGPQLVPHRLDARIECGFDADRNRGLHQRFPRLFGAIIGALRYRRCRA